MRRAVRSPARAAAPRRSPWPRFLATWRIATAHVRRMAGSSLLAVCLIAMPIAVMSAAFTTWAGRVPTLGELLASELGHVDAWVAVVGGPDPSRHQKLSDPLSADIDRNEDDTPVNPERPPVGDAAAVLPAGLETLQIGEGWANARTAGGTGSLRAVIGPSWDSRLSGRYTLVAGRSPHGPDEAMVSPAALHRLGASLGDTLTLTEPAATFTITGVLRGAADADSAQTLFLPGTDRTRALQTDVTLTRWLVPDWTPTEEDVHALNAVGVAVFARNLVTDTSLVGTSSGFWPWAVTAGAAFGAWTTALLVGAAISAGARREARSMAVMSGVGAHPRDLFAVILWQGTVLGIVGGIAGACAGVGIGTAVLSVLDDGAVSSFWGAHVPWAHLAGLVAFGALVGTAAAVLPARAAARRDVLTALRETRTPPALRHRWPLIGVAGLIAGVATTALGASALAALNAIEVVRADSIQRRALEAALLCGPLLCLAGLMLSGHALFSALSRPLSRMGVALRIAARDLAAHPGRTVPAFGTIATCAFLASTLLSVGGVFAAALRLAVTSSAPPGTVLVTAYPAHEEAGPADTSAALTAARPILQRTGPAAIGSLSYVSADTEGDRVLPQLQHYLSCREAVTLCTDEDSALARQHNRLAVVAPEDLPAVLGTEVPEAALAAFRNGAALVLSPDWLTADGKVVLNGWREEQLWQSSAPAPRTTRALSAVAIASPHPLAYQVLVSPTLALGLGLLPEAQQLIAHYDTPPSQSVMDSLSMNIQAVDSRHPRADASVELVEGPPDAAGWLWLILGVSGVLILVASTVALSLGRAERGPDEETLASLGADPGLLRSINARQALVLTGVGTLAGAATGILPTWGLLMAEFPTGLLTLAVAPWPLLGLLAGGLPLLLGISAWVIPPRAPRPSRRAAIG
ncbi:ABC transporter permease [Propionicicella superfundia]|uniref:ABC transporter permease n=1 Tax=Propionicicella superfundia TaxID=348582 RepID=UPI00048DDAD5|nr:ABC transporter permease [Propionicicella superfundia]